MKHHKPSWNHDSEPWQTMTKPWQWNITTHDTSWTMTKHHDTSQHITKHYEPLQNTINHHNLYKNYCKLSQKNVLQHEYILFPYNIYLYQKIDRPGFAYEKNLNLTDFTYFIQKSSPTLKTKRRSILTKLTYGRDPLPRNFPISWYYKLDTGMHKPNIHPELENATNVAIGLAAQTCQFDKPCTNLAWCSFPGEPHSELVYLISFQK